MDFAYYPSENSKNALIVLTGLGGSAKSEKYVKIAENATKKYKFEAYVIGVPKNCWDNPQTVFEEAVEYVINKTAPENIYIAGNSAGASLAIWYSHFYPQIKKVLAVNPVLNLNVHKTRSGINNFFGENIYVFVGENDPYAPYLGLLPERHCAEYKILDGVDHSFSGKIDGFISLFDILF